jgi:hypothetical protein
VTQTGLEAAPPERDADPAHTAAYIAALTKELAELARRSELEVVAYLLEIVHLEAAGPIAPAGRMARGRLRR